MPEFGFCFLVEELCRDLYTFITEAWLPLIWVEVAMFREVVRIDLAAIGCWWIFIGGCFSSTLGGCAPDCAVTNCALFVLILFVIIGVF